MSRIPSSPMRPSRAARAAVLRLVPFAALALVACKGGDTGPRTPSAIQASSTTSFTASVASAVSPVPTVRVNDAGGRGVSGALVRWRVLSGGGRVTSDTVRTTASGTATPGAWTLGNAAGTQELEAAVDGVGTVRFTAQAAAGPLNKLIRISADAQAGIVGEPVQSLPSVRAEDAHGNPLSGIAVTFSVVSGGGTVTGSSKTTNLQGVATVDGWTLGGTKGQQLLRSSSGGVIATFSANAAAGPPALIEAVGSMVLEGVVSGSAISPVPLVRVRDSFGNTVGGVTVTFTPGPNSGTVTGGTQTTDAQSGIAGPTSWVLGDGPTSTLEAAVAVTPSIAVTIQANAVVSLFKIEVRWVGPVAPSARTQLAMQRAVDKWRGVIVGNPGVSNVIRPAAGCRSGTWLPDVNEVVDGMLIIASIGAVESGSGVGGVLANANVCTIHAQTRLPAYGTILIDQPDIPNMENTGAIDAVLLHEMGHSLGFSSGIFTLPQFPHILIQSPFNPHFIGPNAVEQFLALGGGSISMFSVPLDSSTSANGVTAHWRKSVFANELMNPSINLQNPVAPLSRVTVGLMNDIGHQVNYNRADVFNLPGAAAFGFPATLSSFGDDVIHPPGGVNIAPTVRLVPVRR